MLLAESVHAAFFHTWQLLGRNENCWNETVNCKDKFPGLCPRSATTVYGKGKVSQTII